MNFFKYNILTSITCLTNVKMFLNKEKMEGHVVTDFFKCYFMNRILVITLFNYFLCESKYTHTYTSIPRETI